MADLKSQKLRFSAPLEFSGGLTQLQWCTATLRRLEIEVQKKQTALSIEHSSVTPLLSGLLSPCLPSVQAVCSVLVSAISRGMIGGDPVITSLVSSCASMPHWPVGVDVVGEMMAERVLAAVERNGSYTCPYSLRTSPHPFISMINSRPDIGVYVADLAIQMLNNSKHSKCFRYMLQLLGPFLKYFLIHPSPSPEHCLTSSHLHSSLLTLAQASHPHQSDDVTSSLLLLHTLTRLLPLTPSHTHKHILTLSHRIQGLVDVWSGSGGGDVMTELVDSCLAVCCNLSQVGLSLEPLLNTVLHIITPPAKVVLSARHIFCLSWLMLHSLLVPATVNLILKIVSVVAECSPELSLLLMTLPVIQVLSLPAAPNAAQRNVTTTLQNAANNLLKTIQKHASCECKFKQSEVQCSSLPLHCQPYPLLTFTAHTFATVTSSHSELITWLKEISHKFRLLESPMTSSASLDHLAIILSALSLRIMSVSESSDSDLPLVFTALTAIARADPTISPPLLPVFLYLLPLISFPACQLALLYTLPSLSTHPLAVGPTANTLRTLGGTPSLISVSLRLLGKLWVDHDSVYPHLHTLLAQSAQSGMSFNVAREFELAKAAVIRDVCSLRAEQHGEEMLSLLSAVIGQSGEGLAVALATEALAALCRADVVDPATVWTVLGERLAEDSRVPVAIASCILLSHAASVDSEQRSAAKKFKTMALKHLWKTVFSQKADVCSAALEALGKFRLEDFLVEHLPPKALSSLGIPPPLVDPFTTEPGATTETLLSGCHCVQLITVLPVPSLPALSHFLGSFLPTELEAIPRGVVSSAMQQCQGQSSLEKAVRETENVLRGVCLANQENDSEYGLVAGTGVLLNGVASLQLPFSRRETGGQVAVKEMKEYGRLLEEAVQRGRVCVDVEGGTGGEGTQSALCALTLPKHWALFMKKVCDSFSKARLVRKYPASIWEDTTALEEKSLEATEWAKQELVKKLTEYANASADFASILLLALVGVVCADDYGGSGTATVVPSESLRPWSRVSLLCLTLRAGQSLLTGNKVENTANHPLLALLTALAGTSVEHAAMLVCPLLVETGLSCCTVPPQSLCTDLEALACSMWNQFSKFPLWHSGIVLNKVLVMLLPRLNKIRSITRELVPLCEAAVQSRSLELLSLVSSLLPSLCVADQTPTAVAILSTTVAALQTLSPEELMLHQAQLASLHAANASSVFYSNGIVSDEQAMQHVTLLADLATKVPQVPVYHLSLSVILHGLLAACHPSVLPLADAVAVRWVQESSAPTSPDKVLPVVWGLAGLTGVNPITNELWYNDVGLPSKFVGNLFPLVKEVLEKLSAHVSQQDAASIVWILGQMYHTLISTFDTKEKVPTDYSYLPDTALLPMLIYCLLELCAQPITHTDRIKSLLSVLSSCTDTFPPCDLSAVILSLVKIGDLQMNCIQLLVNQCHKAKGLKLLATHVLNMMLQGCLQAAAQVILQESLPGIMNLMPVWKYLHPLCTSALQHYPESQELLYSLLKGLKTFLSSGKDTSPSECDDMSGVAGLVVELWRGVCGKRASCETLRGRDEMVLRLCADCLWMVDYKPVLLQSSVSAVTVAWDCLLQCCWVMNGRRSATHLSLVLSWIMETEEGYLSKIVHGKLVETIRYICFDSKSKNTLLLQTELLHMIVVWTREKKATALQMRTVLLLCIAVSSPTPPACSDAHDAKLDLEPWLVSFTLPVASVLQEKVLQCVLEWLAYNDNDIHRICLAMLECFTMTLPYSKPLVWTSAAHLL